MSDWNLEEGMRSAHEDTEWERELGDPDALHPGQIRIKVKGGRIVHASGAGLVSSANSSSSFLRSPPRYGRAAKATTDGATHTATSTLPAVVTPKREPPRIVSKEAIPDIATKSAKAHDLYAVCALLWLLCLQVLAMAVIRSLRIISRAHAYNSLVTLQAAPQHDSYGLELTVKSLRQPLLPKDGIS
jgi:hypothetical protein